MTFLRLQQKVKLVNFLFKFTVLFSCILFEFDFFVKNSFFVAEITHAIDESF